MSIKNYKTYLSFDPTILIVIYPTDKPLFYILLSDVVSVLPHSSDLQDSVNASPNVGVYLLSLSFPGEGLIGRGVFFLPSQIAPFLTEEVTLQSPTGGQLNSVPLIVQQTINF